MKLPPEAQDSLAKIDTSSKFLLGLINDILDLSKAESGKLQLNPEPYTPIEFRHYVDAIASPLFASRYQHFVYESQHLLDDRIPLFDKLRFNQVIFNLLSNASKYSPEGASITYRIDQTPLPRNRTSYKSWIMNTGLATRVGQNPRAASEHPLGKGQGCSGLITGRSARFKFSSGRFSMLRFAAWYSMGMPWGNTRFKTSWMPSPSVRNSRNCGCRRHLAVGQTKADSFTTLDPNWRSTVSSKSLSADIAELRQPVRASVSNVPSVGSDLRLQRFKVRSTSQSRSSLKLPTAPVIPTIARRDCVATSVTLLETSTTIIGSSRPSTAQTVPARRSA
jgi:hypothetical protein